MKKTLFILDEIKYSGAEVMIAQATAFLHSKNYDIIVLSTGEIEGEHSPTMQQKGCIVQHIPFRKNFRFFKNIYHFMVKEQCDVVHIHTERAFFFYSAIAWLAKCPVIIRTVHNVFQFSGVLRI